MLCAVTGLSPWLLLYAVIWGASSQDAKWGSQSPGDVLLLQMASCSDGICRLTESLSSAPTFHMPSTRHRLQRPTDPPREGNVRMRSHTWNSPTHGAQASTRIAGTRNPKRSVPKPRCDDRKDAPAQLIRPVAFPPQGANPTGLQSSGASTPCPGDTEGDRIPWLEVEAAHLLPAVRAASEVGMKR